MKYKTEMCRNWDAYGRCKFGKTCAFAHGEHELQRKQHVPNNYKTRACKQFHEEMFCPYGVRCQFLHSDKIRPGRELGYLEVLKENALQMEKRTRACGSSIDDVVHVNLFSKPRLSVFKELSKKGQKESKEKKKRSKAKFVAEEKAASAALVH